MVKPIQKTKGWEFIPKEQKAIIRDALIKIEDPKLDRRDYLDLLFEMYNLYMGGNYRRSSSKTLRNYMMIHDFDKFIIENRGHVGNTFIDLSVKYNISEKQAKNIVYKQRDKFNSKSNILTRDFLT